MRRALVVIHTPSFGGPHNQALRLRAPLLERGWETLVVLPDEAGTGATRLEDGGLEVLRIPLGRARATPNPFTQARSAIELLRDVRRLRGLLRETASDLVQVHGVQNPQGALAAAREGVPVVWQLLGTSAPRWVRRLLTPLTLRLADVVMTTGRRVAEEHPGVSALRDRWLPFFPPLDVEEFRPDEGRRAAARRELGVSDGALVVGTVGNYFRAKAHEDLVRAAALLLESVPTAEFRILGEQPVTHSRYYQRDVVARAAELGLGEDRLRFVNPGSRVAELLPGFDVFALSSIAEGAPNVVLEAMGCALPVVGTQVGSVAEMIEEGVTGLLVPPRTPEALAAAIARLAGDRDLRREMGSAGRRRAVARFAAERCADRYVEAYEAALARRSG